MDRDYAIKYLMSRLKLAQDAAERKLDSLINVYAPELDAISVSHDTSLTREDEAYFIRIVNNEK